MPSSTTSNYLTQKLLDLALKNTAWTPPATHYVAFCVTVPSLAGTGGVEVSTSGTGYARQPVSASGGWAGPSGANQEYSNVSDIIFAVPTANWGTISGAAIYDAAVGGNLLWVATLTTPKTVSNGDGAPRILAGQLRIARATC